MVDLTDLSGLAHRVIDGVMVGDKASILIAVGYALVMLGTTWLSLKTVKASARCAYCGAKWAFTPRQDSELAQRLMSKFDTAKLTTDGTSDEDLCLGEVRYQSKEFPFKTFKKIYVNGHEVTDLLTRRERKKLFGRAYRERKATWKRDGANALACAKEKALEALSPPKDSHVRVVEVKKHEEQPLKQTSPPKPEPVKGEAPEQQNKGEQAGLWCMCGTCVAARARKA